MKHIYNIFAIIILFALAIELGNDAYLCGKLSDSSKIENKDFTDSNESNEDQKEDSESESEKKETVDEEKIFSNSIRVNLFVLEEINIKVANWNYNSLRNNLYNSVIYFPPEQA